jgi:Plasmid pRiA4b ORF-3-like protein
MARKTTKPSAPAKALQLKIALLGSQPPIWRRVLVSPDTTLENLHWVIQVVMPWTNSHLHDFADREGKRWTSVNSELEDTEDESTVTIGKLLGKPRAKLLYTYDFGDTWEHAIELEKTIETEPGQSLPTCIKGARNAPPDDCGGIWGYADFLAAIKNPQHSEHANMLEWIGGKFDPEAFDLDEINRNLKRLKM